MLCAELTGFHESPLTQPFFVPAEPPSTPTGILENPTQVSLPRRARTALLQARVWFPAGWIFQSVTVGQFPVPQSCKAPSAWLWWLLFHPELFGHN